MMDRRRLVTTLAGGLAIVRSIAETQAAAKVYQGLGVTIPQTMLLCADEAIR